MNKSSKPDDKPKDDAKPEGSGEPIETKPVELAKRQSTLTPEK